MRSPWKKISDLEPDAEYLVLASAIPAKSVRSTWRMFRGASAIRRQLSTTEGIIGFSLLARPLRRQYATLSLWTDQAALDAFVHASPHSEIMGALAAELGPTSFERWTTTGSQGRPSWSEALRRLG